MPATSPNLVIERRRSPRKSDRIKALVGPKDSKSDACENAMIEELGKTGLRIRSGAPLNPDESFFLYVGDDRKPTRAKVIWVKKEGFIEKRRTGKAGQAFVAGVKLRELPTKEKEPKARGAAARRAEVKRDAEFSTRVVRWVFIGGGVGLLALIIYAVVSLVQLMG
jgi:hypothetical protein